ncbi:MAG: hypothetical protein AB8F34_15595 [Akkermansiaceae bacterium]
MAVVAVQGETTNDWRLQLLKEQGISSKTSELEKFQQNLAKPGKALNKAVKQLGSEDFMQREQAQNQLQMMGQEILPSLHKLKKSGDPEVQVRLEEIIRRLEKGGRWEKGALTRRAIASLLHDRKNPGKKDPQGIMFVEFFQKPQAALGKEYQKLRFSAAKGMGGFVAKGVARMKGQHGGDGDQRLLLYSKDLTGKAVFPDSFRIEAKLGSEPGGAGTHHVGISIGNVRALFHPGYNTGAFRFERVNDNKYITRSADMGFTPPAGKLLPMSVEVKRLKNGDVKLDVQVTSGKDTYRATQTIKFAIIGKLQSIGLDRSGRTGGDGLFDDFIVDLGKP